MKRIFISALAFLGMGTMANAQFSVYDQYGKVLFTMPTTPAYVDFQYQKPTTGTENGHGWVDLGLPSGTKWATCNVGADAPEQYGSYFAWGETLSKSNYDWSTYFDTNDDGGTFVKYNNGGKHELDDTDDVAAQAWGGAWKIPTFEQQEELTNNCYWVWTDTYNDKSVNGYIVYKAKKVEHKGVYVYDGNTPLSDYDVATDAHIFLPAAGFRYDDILRYAGDYGDYWLRSLTGLQSCAHELFFYSNSVRWSDSDRGAGQSVRPVCLPAAE